jgi:hypothetical protein
MIRGVGCGAIVAKNDWQEKSKFWDETCLIAALIPTDPTRLHPGSNSGHRRGKPATNRLSYGTDIRTVYSLYVTKEF